MQKIEDLDLVLVALMPSVRDLEIARVLGWYRIPLVSAPKTLRVDWIAFYLTAAFGEERWSVRYVAPVRGYELVRRIDLLQDEPDHPRAREPYYKVQLGPLQTLSRPIPSSSWRRFLFLYTIGRLLLSAKDLRELTVPSSPERELLWRMIRERAEPDGIGPSVPSLLQGFLGLDWPSMEGDARREADGQPDPWGGDDP
jgi:hypothetical protein